MGIFDKKQKKQKKQIPRGKYNDIIEYHSWGESIGISKALVFVANELAELNKNLKDSNK